MILIIDDEPGIRNTVKDILEDESYKVLTAEDGLIGLELLRHEDIDVVILDVWLPRMGGIDVLKAIRSDFPKVETIVISGHASIDMAVNAVKLGAFDFIEKPLSIERIITTVRNAYSLFNLKLENARLKHSIEDENILAKSEKMTAIIGLIEQSAKSDARVLITGENGTGKELAARRIHRLSARGDNPFIAVNCAAMPDTLIESELFGHEKGSFTDAVARRKGKFELAHGGTLFMDEIADMSLSAQAKILRVIQEMRFERLGGEETISIDVRVIAATNKDLRKEISEGRFREDLFFRLNVIPIHIPALRDRPEDIALLSENFIKKFILTGQRAFSDKAMELIQAYSWPGNIRELKNFIERVAVMTDEAEISAETVEHFLGAAGISTEKDNTINSLTFTRARDTFERSYLVHNLRKNGYNISKTAESIGLSPSNLHAKIKKFAIGGGE